MKIKCFLHAFIWFIFCLYLLLFIEINYQKFGDSHYNNQPDMRLVIWTILAISLATFVVKSNDELRMLQKQNSLSKGLISSFFGSNSQDKKTVNNKESFEGQDLQNNLEQLAKALPYQMLLPRRKNSFSPPLGLLGNFMKASNQKQSIIDLQNNPMEDLNELLAASRKKKTEKKPFHWENPDFKEGKKDIPIYKIFGSKSNRNHRLQISEEEVQNILENQIPSFRNGKLLKLSETSYRKGFFLNVEFLTTKNQVYKVKAKYNEQDNELQIMSMSELINFVQPKEEKESQSVGEEGEAEEEEKFIIQEILSEYENQDNSDVGEQSPQTIIQNQVKLPVQIKKEALANPIQSKIIEKADNNINLPTPIAQEVKKEVIKQQPAKQKGQEAFKDSIKYQKQVKEQPIKQEKQEIILESAEQQPKKEQKKQAVKEIVKQQPNKAAIKEAVKQQPKKEQKKETFKEAIKEEPIKKQNNVIAQQKKVQKILQESDIQTKLPSPPKIDAKKQAVNEYKQLVKQSKKDEKPTNEAKKISSNLSKQKQNNVDKPSLENAQKQVNDLSKSQPKPLDKLSSDKQTNSKIVQN